MNWKLIFKKSGAFVEIYDKNDKPILCREFKGWRRHLIATGESGHLLPKFDLEKNESVIQDNETSDLVIEIKK